MKKKDFSGIFLRDDLEAHEASGRKGKILMTKKSGSPKTMEELVELMGDKLVPFTQGEVTDVTVVAASKDQIIVDIAGLATGLIPEKELSATSSRLKPGDTTRAYVMSLENDNGYVILSQKRAERERLWHMVEQRNTAGETISVKIIGANKGGVVAEYGNMQGFIPVSQLSYKHYPRVEGDRNKIQRKLTELIGTAMEVKILSFEKNTNKIIFSEKAVGDAEVEAKALQYTVGQKVKGTVTGVVDFGLFVSLGEIEGLVHISQASWQRVNNLKELFKVGQEVEAEIVSIDGGRISLSIKKLLPDPWQIEIKNVHLGDKITGLVTKVTPYGAFVKISDNLEGLLHASQIDQDRKPQDVVAENKEYLFEVVSIEPELRKISLKISDDSAEAK